MKKLNIILDVDGVLMACISAAIPVLKERTGYVLNYEDITEWNFKNLPEDVAKQMLDILFDPDFVQNQKPFEGAREMICNLTEKGHKIMIFSAIPPELMGIRANAIMRYFPEIPLSNITLGGNKNLMAGDVLLDDGLHNVIDSRCKYPILMRRPWNAKEKRILSVSNYDEFVALIDKIAEAPQEFGQKATLNGHPGFVALVGPSASGKTAIMTELLKDPRFALATALTTRQRRESDRPNEYHYVDRAEFNNMVNSGDMLEHSEYAGNCYGVSMKDLTPIWDRGQIPVKAMDITGAQNAKRKLGEGVVTVFIRRDKEQVVNALLNRITTGESSADDVAKRILTLDGEYANEPLCDWTISNNGTIQKTVQQILNIL